MGFISRDLCDRILPVCLVGLHVLHLYVYHNDCLQSVKSESRPHGHVLTFGRESAPCNGNYKATHITPQEMLEQSKVLAEVHLSSLFVDVHNKIYPHSMILNSRLFSILFWLQRSMVLSILSALRILSRFFNR